MRSVRWVHLTVRSAKTGCEACRSHTRGLAGSPRSSPQPRGVVINLVPTRWPQACGNDRHHQAPQPHALGRVVRVEMSAEHSPTFMRLVDVTLRDVMNVEYFSNPSTGSSIPIRGTCASPRRPARQPNPSRAVLPQGWRKTPGSLAFWLWWPRCRCCGCRRWARLMLPLAGEQGPMMVRTQPERRAIKRVAYVVVLAAELLNNLHE